MYIKISANIHYLIEYRENVHKLLKVIDKQFITSNEVLEKAYVDTLWK